MANLNDLKTALLTIGVPVGHYSAFEQSDKYIVWAEYGQSNEVWADGKMQQQAISATVDYFTKTENDVNVSAIQQAFNAAELSWRLESIQYEDDTKFIHFEWVVEVEQWQE